MGSRVDVGDRTISVLVSLTNPNIVVFEGLLDETECNALILAAKPRLQRSTTVTKDGKGKVDENRTSNGMAFRRGENPLIQRIEARISKLLQVPNDRGEGIQVVQYPTNGEYKPHHDFFDLSDGATGRDQGGQRVGTLIMYLSDEVRGGSTVFPKLNLEIYPRRGNGVFFSYPGPVPDQLTLHGGAPVLEGEKWIATKWLRESSFSDVLNPNSLVAPIQTSVNNSLSWIGS